MGRWPQRRTSSTSAAATAGAVCPPGDHFDHGNDVRRVRPMHADDAARHARAGLNVGDRNSGRVGGENAVVGDMRLDLAKHLDLEIEIFGHRLDDEIGARDAAPRDCRATDDVARRCDRAPRAPSAPWPRPRILDAALSRLPGSASKADTFKPARASVAAMPGPMVPRPMTAALFMADPPASRSGLRLLVGRRGTRTCRARP